MDRTLKAIRHSAWLSVRAILPYTVAGLILIFTMVLWTCSSMTIPLSMEPVLIELDPSPEAAGEEGDQTVGGDEVVEEPWGEEWEPGERGEPRDEEPENGGPEGDDRYRLEDTEPTPEDMEYGEHPAVPYDDLAPTGSFLPRTGPPPEREYARALNNLQEGNVVYPERQDMHQGLVKVVSVRVYFPDVPPVVRAMEEHEVVETIRISNIMCADLVDVEGVFQISPMTEKCQITARPHTEWLWAVLPRVSGEYPMVLNVTNEIKVDGDKGYRTEIAKMAIINVEIDIWYTTKTFFAGAWQWILMSLGGLAGIWGFCRRLVRRRKDHDAGF